MPIRPRQTGAFDQSTQRRRVALVILLAGAAFALSGCESLMVMTGARIRLDGVPLQSISATLPGSGGLAPGGSARLAIVATTTDGRTLATVGTGDGKVLGDSYVYEGGVVTVDEDGVVRLPDDPRLSEGRTPHVHLHAANQATPVADIDIPIRYDVPYAATLAGVDGTHGFDGSPGLDGSPGNMGSFDPDNPSAGGNGGNGGDGGDGDNGGDGSPGPDIHVTIALAPGSAETHPLLRVRVSASGHDRFFIVDPDGGSLALAVSGGAAGRAGSGGRGGAGGSGGPGMPPGMPGLSGRNGWDGHAGQAGNAGSVTMAVDPAAARYLDRFHIRNTNGDGLPGPPPTVMVAPVASPW